MKILHTSDWHLGVKTEGYLRLDEQRKIMKEIIKIADDKNVDIVIVAGDVYQKSLPSAEAEDLFFDTIKELSNDANRVVVVIAGNHDDPKRLEAGLPLAGKHNIVIAGGVSTKIRNKAQNKRLEILESGDGYITVKKQNEKCVIAFLPYMNESRMGNKTDDTLSFGEKIQKWAQIGAEHFDNNSFNIFASHLYLVGAKDTNNDNNFEVKVGDALAVERKFLPNAHYYALGHIHSSQQVFENAYYSGAPINLRVHDNAPSVLIIEGYNTGVSKVEEIKIKSSKIIKKINAISVEDAIQKLSAFNDNSFVYLTITQESSLLTTEVKDIKQSFPFVVNIKLEKKPSQNSLMKITGKKKISKRELFSNYYTTRKNKEPSKELVELFLEMIEEGNNETD